MKKFFNLKFNLKWSYSKTIKTIGLCFINLWLFLLVYLSNKVEFNQNINGIYPIIIFIFFADLFITSLYIYEIFIKSEEKIKNEKKISYQNRIKYHEKQIEFFNKELEKL